MYVKLFRSIYQGTLRGNSHGLLVFTNLLANADSLGSVDVHPRAIAEETGLAELIVRAALDQLEAPDPESRSPEEDGRRIIRLNDHRAWGWRIVNYGKYREIKNAEDRREQNRLAQERWRAKNKPTSASRKQRNHESSQSAHAEAEGEAEADKKKKSPSAHPAKVGDEGRFPEFWGAWPQTDRKQDRRKCLAKWKAFKLDAIADEIIAHVTMCRRCQKWLDGYEPATITYLSNRRWEEPVPPTRPAVQPAWAKDHKAAVAAYGGALRTGETIEMETTDATRPKLG